MGWFSRSEDDGNEQVLAEIKKLREQVAQLQAERKAASEALKLQESINNLRKEITKLEIERDKKVEAHEREKREVTHMVGLEKKRQAFEIEQAKRETTVSVREENLQADRKRFEEQMEFMTDRFTREVGYLKEIMDGLMERLPTVEVQMNPGGGNRR